jgi:hypothetical protein
MSGHQEVSYTLEVGIRRQRARKRQASSQPSEKASGAIPRVARLLALAIRLEGLIREGAIRDYSEVARLGRVTRARITQIMKLLNLAPDIQEQILFLPPSADISERVLRPIANQLDWDQQRHLFQVLLSPSLEVPQ